jgi:tetratricopeptide (TPR) repeat protein
MFSGDVEDARQWLVALFVTSSLLHFYYDGFIWKVSERKTRENLAEAADSMPAVDRLVPSMVHAGKWLVLLAVAWVLLAAERRYQGGDPADREQADRRMLAALSQLTPDVPEAKAIAEQLAASDADSKYQAGLEALKRGDANAAIPPLQAAIALDQDYYEAHLQLGDALIAVGKAEAAGQAFARAIELRPNAAEGRIGLADAQIKGGQLDSAEATLRAGLAVQPDSPELSFTLGLLLRETGRTAEAERFLDKAAKLGLSPAGR